MTDKKPKRPRDPNELAKLMVDIASGEVAEPVKTVESNPAAALGRLGGLKGGPARAVSLSDDRRRDIAERAAKARWGKNGEKTDKTKK